MPSNLGGAKTAPGGINQQLDDEDDDVDDVDDDDDDDDDVDEGVEGELFASSRTISIPV